MFIFVLGVLIVFGILLFICYSYMQNQRSKYVAQMYKEFKEQYAKDCYVAMGFSQVNVFSKPVTLMVAVGKEDHRVIDAWAVSDKDMEIEGRTCEEYIGIDIKKYARNDQEKIQKDLLMRKPTEIKTAKEKAFAMAVTQILNQK